MNRELVRKLSLYIIDQLQDREAPISTIRLVKLLYLIDLEYYNRRNQTLTGIDWLRYKYGPYFMELPEIIRSVGIDLETTEVMTERGRGFTFRTLQPQDISETIDFATEALINRVIDKWADEDTSVLLEYVYETLPVKYGKMSEPLDFSYETDHLILQLARESAEDFVTLDELLAEFGDASNESARM